jgi:hypothetical protein
MYGHEGDRLLGVAYLAIIRNSQKILILLYYLIINKALLGAKLETLFAYLLTV